jgi:hypothetical protein
MPLFFILNILHVLLIVEYICPFVKHKLYEYFQCIHTFTLHNKKFTENKMPEILTSIQDYTN